VNRGRDAARYSEKSKEPYLENFRAGPGIQSHPAAAGSEDNENLRRGFEEEGQDGEIGGRYCGRRRAKKSGHLSIETLLRRISRDLDSTERNYNSRRTRRSVIFYWHQKTKSNPVVSDQDWGERVSVPAIWFRVEEWGGRS